MGIIFSLVNYSTQLPVSKLEDDENVAFEAGRKADKWAPRYLAIPDPLLN